MRRNLLIFFPYFAVAKLIPADSRDEWEVISITDLLKKGTIGLVRFLREKTYDTVVVARPDISRKEAKYYLLGILFIAAARQKYLIGNDQKKHSISWKKFIFIDTPEIILEGIFSVFFLILSWIWLGFLWVFFSLTQHRNFKQKNTKHIAYFRTDDFGEIAVGGSFSHVDGFRKGAQNFGWKIFFIAHARPIKDTNVAAFIIPFPHDFNTPEIPEIYYGFRLLWKSLKILKREKPTFIYHRHTAFQATTPLLARLLGIPLILEYNGSEAWVKEKWGRLFMRNLCYAFEKVAFLGADKIAVVSDVLKDELITRGIAQEKIIVNPNGVDPHLFHPQVDGSAMRKKYGLENKIVIGFIGSFGPWHGVEVLARSIKPIIKAFPHMHFLIMGDGALRSSVETIISVDGVKNAATLTGTIPHDESPQYLAACDILASPHVPNVDGTRFFGSPTKLFEYMAMGKAIVASNLEQIGTVLEDEKTALLTKPGDIHDFVKAVIRLIPDSEFRKKLGENARKEVVQKYTWDQNAKRIIHAYENLVGKQ
ncbi:MAG: glycosyltransferase family 4 protein [Patescibacteria group bacterium]